jgi:hypothetical protein
VFSTDPPDRFYLSAPTSGRYEGLLFIQDRTQATSCVTLNKPVNVIFKPQNMVLDGAIYFPNHHIEFGATIKAAGNYTILIGGTLEFSNKSSFNSNFSGLATGSPVKRPGLGE